MADPITTLIGGGAGLLLGGLGSLFGGGNAFQQLGSPSDVTNVNPLTGQVFSTLQGNLGQFQQGLAGAGQQQLAASQQQERLLNQLLNVQPTAQLDPQAAQRQFLGAAPALQGLVEQSLGGTPQSVLQGLENQAVQNVTSQFAPELRGSSAFAQAVGQGVSQPLFQAAQQEQALRANTLGSLLGQQQALSFQNAANQFAAQQAADQFRANQLLQGIGGFQNLGQQALGQQQLFGGLVGGTQNLLGQLGQQQFFQPAFAQNPNFLNTQDVLGLGLAGAGIGLQL